MRQYGSCIEKLYQELERCEITFRPHIYIADEWFSPSTSPAIAVPFYLFTKELRREAKKNLGQNAEGFSKKDFMKLLRHECGHAFETAYNLKYSRNRASVFGRYNVPYPTRYQPSGKSNKYVDYLGDCYSSAHPSEDFAETFALWLEKGDQSLEMYPKRSGAYKKLRAMQDIIERMKHLPSKNLSKESAFSYKTLRKSPKDFFKEKSSELRIDEKLHFFNRFSISASSKVKSGHIGNSVFLKDLTHFNSKSSHPEPNGFRQTPLSFTKARRLYSALGLNYIYM